MDRPRSVTSGALRQGRPELADARGDMGRWPPARMFRNAHEGMETGWDSSSREACMPSTKIPASGLPSRSATTVMLNCPGVGERADAKRNVAQDRDHGEHLEQGNSGQVQRDRRAGNVGEVDVHEALAGRVTQERLLDRRVPEERATRRPALFFRSAVSAAISWSLRVSPGSPTGTGTIIAP